MLRRSRTGATPATLEVLRAAGRSIATPQLRRIAQRGRIEPLAGQQAEQLAVWEGEGGAMPAVPVAQARS
jgi:hypothetical protein